MSSEKCEKEVVVDLSDVRTRPLNLQKCAQAGTVRKVNHREREQEWNEAQHERAGKQAGIEHAGEPVTREHEEAPAVRRGAASIRLVAALIDCHCVSPLLPWL